MVFPGPAAGDAWAAQGAGRLGANLLMHQEVVRGYPSVLMALARDFPWASSAWALPGAMAHQDVRVRCQERKQQDAWPMAVFQPAQQAALREAQLVLPQERQADE
jgi:hypothetical protein